MRSNEDANPVEQWFDGLPVSQLAKEEFVPQHGALTRKYVAANDNKVCWRTIAESNECRPWLGGIAIDDNLITDQPPAAPARISSDRGPYVATTSGRKFYPLSPRPDETHIEDIAHGLSMLCRYNGAVKRFLSVAEHSVVVSRSLERHGPLVQLCGLLHDAPEALSGLGDVTAPMKREVPEIGQIENGIWRHAVAPRFGLPVIVPHAVHVSDMRIRGNEVRNMVPMDWHSDYRDPLPVELQYWSPDEAETEFLAEYVRLERKLGRV